MQSTPEPGSTPTVRASLLATPTRGGGPLPTATSSELAAPSPTRPYQPTCSTGLAFAQRHGCLAAFHTNNSAISDSYLHFSAHADGSPVALRHAVIPVSTLTRAPSVPTATRAPTLPPLPTRHLCAHSHARADHPADPGHGLGERSESSARCGRDRVWPLARQRPAGGRSRDGRSLALEGPFCGLRGPTPDQTESAYCSINTYGLPADFTVGIEVFIQKNEPPYRATTQLTIR